MKLANEALAEKVRNLPRQPGIYKFKDAEGKTIYVGKATSLRSRVSSYFQAPDARGGKIVALVAQIADVEYILTGSPLQALQWESDLIKTERPKYNVVLRDDKHYPYVRVTVQEDWPRVEIARRIAPDGAKYFGPFSDTGSVRRTMNTLNRMFPYILCSKEITGTDPRPCLYAYINRCLAPCIGAVTKEQYRVLIDQVVRFMEGKTEGVLKELRRDMEEAADRLDFEQAAVLRDRLREAERVVEQQAVTTTVREELDVIGIARNETHACAQVFFMRDGRMVGREHFILQNALDETEAALTKSFLLLFYAEATHVPRRILLSHAVDDQPTVKEWLASTARHAVNLQAPKRGEPARLVGLALRNATETLERLALERIQEIERTSGAMLELQEALGLPNVPERIECFDISHVQGAYTVASMAVLEGARPKPSEYRRFRIRTVDHNDDFASMREVIRRRFGHLVEQSKAPTAEGQKWGVIPDLVVIDGGKGQLSSAQDVMGELELEIPMVGLAKQYEEVFVPNRSDPIPFPADSAGRFLLQRVRDEAHRFAITYHRASRGKGALKSSLDEIPGVGPKRRKALLQRFGSVDAIRKAVVDDIASVPGMTRRTATALKERL
ncbi:MAG TPA: excinuclease ABC subunit UvrC [Chloroflexota bacterium]|nr:excinuclease ABC subunit UvrC [Chloroflexota bacterium]